MIVPTQSSIDLMNLESLNQQSRTYLAQGQLAEAIAICRQAIILEPDRADAYQIMAEALQGQGKLELAMRTYQKAFALDSSRSEVVIVLGNLHAKLGNLEQSLECYQRAIALGDERVEVYRALAQLCHQLDRPDAARSYQDKADRLQPDRASAQAHLNAGNNLFQQGQHLGALQCYQRAIAVHPELAQAHFRQGLIHFWQGAWDKALQSYQRTLSLQPDEKNVRIQLLALRQAQDELEQSMQGCSEVIRLVPTEAEASYEQGNELARQGRLSEAMQQYQEAIALQPDLAEVYFNLGNILCLLNHFSAALENYQKAGALEPDWAEVYLQVGNLWEKANNRLHAIACWQQAIALKPDLVTAYLKLSLAFLIESKAQLSKSVMRQAFQIYNQKREAHPLNPLGIRFWISGGYAHWPFAVKGIGHLAMNFDLHIKIGLLGWRPQYQTVVLAPAEDTINPCLLGYWQRYVTVISDLDRIHQLLPLARELECLETTLYYVSLPDGTTPGLALASIAVQKEWEAQKRPPLLELGSSDRERGWRCLHELGVPEGAWFVTLHVRESGFYGEGDNHPLHRYRNADIETYIPAIEAIAARGGWVVRAGDPSMKALPPMPHVVDYAQSPAKSDWMDIFLCSQCYFFIGMASGLQNVPWVFGVPCVFVNCWPMYFRPISSQDLFIPKLYCSQTDKRCLTFEESHHPDFLDTYYAQSFDARSVEVLDNTPEEIRDAICEMMARLDGSIEYTEEDDRLQKAFSSIAPDYYKHGMSCRIGRDFLRKYANLLPQIGEPSSLESLG
jgi:putative glycosyltransferase (TIGR04372 family)